MLRKIFLNESRSDAAWSQGHASNTAFSEESFPNENIPSSLKYKYDELNRRCKETESEIERLRKDLSRVTETLYQAEDQNTELLTELEKKNMELKKIAQLEDTVSQMQGELTLYQQQFLRVQEQLTKKSEEMKKVKKDHSEEIQQLLSKFKTDSNSETDLTIQNITLSNELLDLREENERLKSALEEIQEERNKPVEDEEPPVSILNEIMAAGVSETSLNSFGCTTCFRRNVPDPETDDKATETDLRIKFFDQDILEKKKVKNNYNIWRRINYCVIILIIMFLFMLAIAYYIFNHCPRCFTVMLHHRSPPPI